jgi:hypothetical protein
MKIDELTIGQVKELVGLFSTQSSIITERTSDTGVWEIGKKYLIRTVTMIDTGRLVAVTPQELVLEDAAWIADTDRFSDALVGKREFKEVEPFPDGKVIIGRGSIIDAVQINIELPRKQK